MHDLTIPMTTFSVVGWVLGEEEGGGAGVDTVIPIEIMDFLLIYHDIYTYIYIYILTQCELCPS